MKIIFRFRILFVTGLLGGLVIFFAACISSPKEKNIITLYNGKAFAGSSSCRNCHRAIYDSFQNTRHFHGSAKATRDFIKGSFDPGSNKFIYNTGQEVAMETHGDSLFQTEYLSGKKIISKPFDIAIGTGKHGQTYLYWENGQLYQLPVSYSNNGNNWANSPGYSMDKVSYGRLIEGRCLECHVTFAKEPFIYEFDPSKIIYGITCERCHGPGEEHVAFQTEHPSLKKGEYIVNPSGLSRQLNLDVCIVCHSSTLEAIRPSFYFVPGDTLAKYFRKSQRTIDTTNLDVHGNQFGLLAASKCFQLSEMTCGSCHNPHVKESGNLAAYSLKCINCHAIQKQNYCTFQPPSGFSMQDNCINCHMPKKESRNIVMMSSGKANPELVRTHLIKIYNSEIQKVIDRNFLH